MKDAGELGENIHIQQSGKSTRMRNSGLNQGISEYCTAVQCRKQK